MAVQIAYGRPSYDSPEVTAWHAEIQEHLDDLGLQAVFADWLEERGLGGDGLVDALRAGAYGDWHPCELPILLTEKRLWFLESVELRETYLQEAYLHAQNPAIGRNHLRVQGSFTIAHGDNTSLARECEKLLGKEATVRGERVRLQIWIDKVKPGVLATSADFLLMNSEYPL